jgi:hypothetical protein
MQRNAALQGFDPIGRLRRLRGDKPIEPSKLAKAVTRIANSPDGKLLLEWLWAQTYGRSLAEDAPDSALREQAANKRLLDKILTLIEEPHASAVDQTQKPAGRRRRSG